MHACLLSPDLMIGSHAAGAANRQAVRLKIVPNAQKLLESFATDPVRLVILDLAAPNLDVESLVAELRSRPDPPRVIAFGPHVHADRLAAARAAGCDRVMARGQFHAQVDDWLKLALD